MPILNCTFQGRFGNQVMQYLFCRGLAERYGYELRCDEWIGDRIFEQVTPRYSGPTLPRYNELTIWDAMRRAEEVEFRGYAQMQQCMTYTKRQAQGWLGKLHPVVAGSVENVGRLPDVIAHRRAGDYLGYGYPVLSETAICRAANAYCFDPSALTILSEETQQLVDGLPKDLWFIGDFMRMVRAPALLRANSTFSWVAGLLSNGIVLSPRIDGLRGGIEHDDVRFEAGNHCKLADFDFCSDLHVAP